MRLRAVSQTKEITGRFSRTLHFLVGLRVPDLRSAWMWIELEKQQGHQFDIHPFPALVFSPWQTSTLATVKTLGITTKTGSVGLWWWNYQFEIGLGISTQKKPNDKVTGR